ncbi:MAG: hypothetical protein V3T23_12460 [Nitrososphaerales archaeon]
MKSKNVSIPTSADQVGERKAYRMTGNLSGKKGKNMSAKSRKKGNPHGKAHNPY